MLYCGDIIKRTLCNCRNSASAMTLSLRLTAKRAQVGPAQARFLPILPYACWLTSQAQRSRC
jgi:hypothetical protein